MSSLIACTVSLNDDGLLRNSASCNIPISSLTVRAGSNITVIAIRTYYVRTRIIQRS